MVRSVVHRAQKVFADERRRMSGARAAKPKAAKSQKETLQDDQEGAEKDAKALEDIAKAEESAPPNKQDPAYELVRRTWRKRHNRVRAGGHDLTVESYFDEHPFMTSWRMVRAAESIDPCSLLDLM